jgi:membrane protease YdiL (CAAX protease family)
MIRSSNKYENLTQSDIKLYSVIVFSALMLCCKEYFGKASIFHSFLNSPHSSFRYKWAILLYEGETSSLYSLLYWAASCVLFYLILPMFFRKIVFPKSPSLFKLDIPLKHWKVYGLMLLIMIIPLISASFLSSFQQTYPFVYIPKEEGFYQILLLWEIGYLCQFVAVEFFFRGFLIFSFEKELGYKAVLIPLIPYVMIHFGKPFPETLGAIVAGLVLGMMALRSKSIVPGICVHFSIAIGMDLLSLWQQGYFTTSP